MLSRLLSYLKYSFLALAAPALWTLHAWLNGRLGTLLASPLPLLLAFAGVGALVVCWLTLRRWLGVHRATPQVPAPPGPREQRLRNIVRVHNISLAGKRQTFLVLNALPQWGSYPPADDGAPRVQDVGSREVGAFSLLEVQSNLLLQTSAEDAGLWWSLLDEFGTTAPQGLVLMIGAEQLLSYNREQRHAAALAWHLRLAELTQRWGRWLSLQILVTECDALAGFLTAQARLAVPLPALNFVPGNNTRALGEMRQQMTALFFYPEDGLFERLEALPDRRTRRNDYIFPADWAALGQTLQETLTLVLAPLRGQRQCWLQSLRFCAGRDDTTVYQRLQQTMSTVRPNSRWRRWEWRCAAAWRLSRHVFWGVFMLMTIGGVLAYFQSERLRLERIVEHLALLEQQGGNTANVGPANELVEQLNRAQRLLEESRARKISAAHALTSDAQRLYRRLLTDMLLPDSRRRLEQAIAMAKIDDEASLLLGHYLTLRGGASKPQTEQAVAWLSESWRSDPLNQLDEQQLGQLAGHLRALFSPSQVEEAKLNQALIQQVRKRLARQPRLQRLLSRLKPTLNDQLKTVPVAESDIDLFFQRADGFAVTSGFFGYYSRLGYQQLAVQLTRELPAALAYDNWLMGNAPDRVTPALTAAILQLYFTEYREYWDDFLAGLSFVLPPAAGWETWMKRLAQRDSALFRLLAMVARETQPTWVGESTEVSPPGTDPVSQHFATLHRALTQDEFGERLRAALLATAWGLQRAEQRPDSLAENVAEAPQALQPLLQGLLAVSRTSMQQQRQALLNNLWQTTVEKSCRTAINGHYPFERQADKEVSLADFNRLFAPQGELDRFLAQTGDERPANGWFMRSERLQEFFFRGEAKQAALSFNVRLVRMHPDIDSFLLTDGEQTLRYAHGPILPVEFHWPARLVTGGLRAQIVLHTGETRQIVISGQWAWFRLFDQAVEPDGAGGGAVTLDFSGYPVRLALTLPDDAVPLALLRDLNCPEVIDFAMARG